VGAAELPELVRQSREYAAQLVAAGRPAQILITSGDDHFSILEQLARPDGALAQEALRLALP
jgi:acetyl esterase/lipase